MLIRLASSRASCSSAMFALGALVACLAVCLVAHVSPVLCECRLTVSLVSLAAKASCGCGVFGCVAFFVLFVVFAWFGLVSLFCLCFVACLRSFTDWCTAHRQQSREQKILRSLEVLICSGRVPSGPSGPFGSSFRLVGSYTPFGLYKDTTMGGGVWEAVLSGAGLTL